MDGVIYRGGMLIDGVLKFLSWLKQENKDFIFLTNNSQSTPQQLRAKLLKMGAKIEEEKFLTAAQTTAYFLQSQKPHNGTCYLVGGPGLKLGKFNEFVPLLVCNNTLNAKQCQR